MMKNTCGINITPLAAQDEGVWTCSITTNSGETVMQQVGIEFATTTTSTTTPLPTEGETEEPTTEASTTGASTIEMPPDTVKVGPDTIFQEIGKLNIIFTIKLSVLLTSMTGGTNIIHIQTSTNQFICGLKINNNGKIRFVYKKNGKRTGVNVNIKINTWTQITIKTELEGTSVSVTKEIFSPQRVFLVCIYCYCWRNRSSSFYSI